MSRRLLYALSAFALTMAVVAIYLSAAEAPFFAKIEGQTLTWRFQLRGPIAPGPETLLVTIDETSLAALGRWPLARSWLARAIEVLDGQGAAVIALDFLLLGSEDEAAGDPDLAESAAGVAHLVLPFAFDYGTTETPARALPPSVARAAYPLLRGHTAGVAAAGPQPSGALLPEPALLEASSPAQVNLFLAADGQLRFAFPALPYGEAYYPSLAVEVVRLFHGLAKSDLLLDLGRGLHIGKETVPLDADSRLIVNHSGPAGSFETVSLVEVIEGHVPAARIKGRIVLIGATALGVGDRFATPFSHMQPGLEYFASVIDNLLHGRAIERQFETRLIDLLAIVLGGGLAASFCLLAGALPALASSLALLLAWCAISYLAFAWGQIWLNFTFPATAIIANLALVAVTRAFGQQAAVRRAGHREAALSRYVSPLVVERLDTGDPSGPIERSQPAAVVFVDLRGFTGLSERKPPREALALLRDFHQRVEEATLACGGTIDKFLGDGALLVFGLPQPGARDAISALACAFRLLDEVAAWNASLAKSGNPQVGLGIGLHFGEVSLGEIGGSRQSQVTVAGDTVNTASRLQALTRSLDVTILASEDLVLQARDFDDEHLLEGFHQLPAQELRGRREKLRVWSWPAPAGGEEI